MVKIYYLERNGEPFYIGKTCNDKERLYKHKLQFGKNVVLNVIDEVDDNEWKFWEGHYIGLFKSWGFKLENRNNGGGGSNKWTDEQKENHRKTYTSEVREKISNNPTRGGKISKALKGRPRSKEAIEKISKGMMGNGNGLGAKRSEEFKGNIIKKLKGRTSPIKGKNLTEEHKNNISKANKGRKVKQETKDKISKAIKGQKSPNSKKVLQYGLEGNFIREWESQTAAAKHYGVTSSSIHSCCEEKIKVSAQHLWRYKTSDEIPLKITPPSNISGKKAFKKVLQYDLEGNFIREWERVNDAKKEIGNAVAHVLGGRLDSYNGYVFKYKE